MSTQPYPAAAYILPIDSAQASLARVGGKGANLARLARAGFAVPAGFLVTTDAYTLFTYSNGLDAVIQSILTQARLDDPQALESASARIGDAFMAGGMPGNLANELRAAYAHLGSPPVAVRSSATAEDLPDLSFAGQQDTYLNVSGVDNLLTAVVACWNSLWTARAIGYRARSGLGQTGWLLAVVVQQMLASDVSGVLFTANPLTGLRSESVIDATFGLGEALVSGQVEPDHYVLDSHSAEIHSQSLGAKQVVTCSKPGGGVESRPADKAAQYSLTDENLKQLVAAGQQIQQEYGAPQDIEWAFVEGKLHILQARPVTSLFPLPKETLDPLTVWFSFGAVQGVVGPMTPLGLDAIRRVAMSAGTLFGGKVSGQPTDLFVDAGERMWIKIGDAIRNPLGWKILGGVLNFVEPNVGKILSTLGTDPKLGAGKGRMKALTVWRLLRFFAPVAAGAVVTLLNPEKARQRLDKAFEDYLGELTIAEGADRFEYLANIVDFMQASGRMANALPFALPRFGPVFVPAMALLNYLVQSSGNEALALVVTRSVPHNVTTEMDLALWRAACAIKADPAAQAAFTSSPVQTLAADYLAGKLPAAAQAAVKGFMDRYGMRGVGEIDFGQPRWREEPAPIMHNLQSYLQIDPSAAPDGQFTRGAAAAQAAIDKLADNARQRRGGWLRARLVRAAARRLRALMGARESPKFFAIRCMGIARQALMAAGLEFTAAGTLTQPQDLAFLNIAELGRLAQSNVPADKTTPDWQALVAERRAVYSRELRRRQIPSVLVSDGRTFYEGSGAAGAASVASGALSGSPVSPGVVEGRVRVVLDPRSTPLAPGEILVCPGTDPAWTPLFMAAGGLITEVGGMMTHGSVVAREYGIPAVVGLQHATQILHDGQRIRLNGTSGEITLLADEISEPDEEGLPAAPLHL